jgi:hypothetical protein
LRVVKSGGRLWSLSAGSMAVVLFSGDGAPIHPFVDPFFFAEERSA